MNETNKDLLIEAIINAKVDKENPNTHIIKVFL